jgi:hypothetical protein
MSATRSAWVVVAMAVLPAAAHADGAADGGDEAPRPLVQPDLSASRTARAQTDFAWFDTGDGPGRLLTERVAADWAFDPTWSITGALPLVYGTWDVGTDPTYHFAEALVGSPSLLGRWRLVPLDGGSRLEVVVAAGVIVATADEERDPADDGPWYIRTAAEAVHMVHRPYDFGFLSALPVRVDARWTAGRTALQAGAAVHTVIDHGDPEVDMILATAGAAHRLAGAIDLLAEGSLLAVPLDDDHVAVDAGIGKQIGAFDLRLRLYLPGLGEFFSGQAVAVDLAGRLD